MSRSARGAVLAALAFAAAVAAFLKRPVRRPIDQGSWDPVDRGASRRR